MSTEPNEPLPLPDTGAFQVIQDGDEEAVVVPKSYFLRLRALELYASREELEDAEDAASIVEFRARDAAGLSTFIPVEEVKRRLGLPR